MLPGASYYLCASVGAGDGEEADSVCANRVNIPRVSAL